MGEVTTIGKDIAKSVFQVHGVDAAGSITIRKRMGRTLRRQTPKVGAVCPNWARTDLCGGLEVTRVTPIR